MAILILSLFLLLAGCSTMPEIKDSEAIKYSDCDIEIRVSFKNIDEELIVNVPHQFICNVRPGIDAF